MTNPLISISKERYFVNITHLLRHN